MGYIAHDAVIITVMSYKINKAAQLVDQFRESLPQRYQPLLVGPIPTVANGDVTYFFAPDGSKEGWPESDEGDRWRAAFMELLGFAHEDGSSPYDRVAVTYGGDYGREHGTTVHEPITVRQSDAGAPMTFPLRRRPFSEAVRYVLRLPAESEDSEVLAELAILQVRVERAEAVVARVVKDPCQ